MNLPLLLKRCAMPITTLALIGCANATFNFTDATRPEDTKPNAEERQLNFFSGFGQRQTIDAAKVCGGADKVASVDVNQSFADAVVATITLGIYTPLSARVFCK
jgi:Bor protein